MRITHVMKANKTNESPSRAIWLNVSSVKAGGRGRKTFYRFKHAVLIHGVKATGAEYWVEHRYEARTSADTLRLICSLLRDKTKTYLISEQAQKCLALTDAFTSLARKGFTCSLAVLADSATCVRWRQDRRSLLWLDATNFLCATSSDILTTSSDVAPIESSAEDSSKLSVARQWLSVETICKSCKLWWHFLIQNDLGGFAPTVGSQALRTYRHKYMKERILIHANQTALELERLAFKGGRTECARLGSMSGRFLLFDVNSMYGKIMAEMQVPTALCTTSNEVTLNDLVKWTRKRAVIAEVTLQTNEPVYAIRDNNKTIFPVGVFKAYLSTPEIRYALDRGHITTIERANFYDTRQCFRDFVCDFWQRRVDCIGRGDSVAGEYYKTLIASFFGKWAQHGGHWVKTEDTDDLEIKTWEEIIYETGEVFEYRQFGGIIQEREHDVESRESMPSIAAHVTAGGRMFLWELMQAVGLQNVLYLDTDSLLIEASAADRLAPYVKPDELGGLRLEGAYEHVTINGLKDYVFGSRVRQKGIKRNARRISDVIFEQAEITSLSRMMRKGDISRVIETRVRKTLSREYDKGVVSSDGRVSPIVKTATKKEGV